MVATPPVDFIHRGFVFVGTRCIASVLFILLTFQLISVTFNPLNCPISKNPMKRTIPIFILVIYAVFNQLVHAQITYRYETSLKNLSSSKLHIVSINIYLYILVHLQQDICSSLEIIPFTTFRKIHQKCFQVHANLHLQNQKPLSRFYPCVHCY